MRATGGLLEVQALGAFSCVEAASDTYGLGQELDVGRTERHGQTGGGKCDGMAVPVAEDIPDLQGGGNASVSWVQRTSVGMVA